MLAGGGPVWSCGYDDHSLPPVRGGGNQGYHTASHFAAMSALTAVLARMVSGEGQFIDVSMHAAANVTTESASYAWLVARQTVQRQTGRHAAVNPSSETQVRCADGRYVNTGVPPRTPAEFARMYAWMKELGLVDEFSGSGVSRDGRRVGRTVRSVADSAATTRSPRSSCAGRDALKVLATRLSAYDFFAGCQSRGLAVGVIYSPDEAFEDAHFKARGFQVPLAHDDLGRTFRYPGAPYLLPASPWRLSRRAPKLGEHNSEILGS